MVKKKQKNEIFCPLIKAETNSPCMKITAGDKVHEYNQKDSNATIFKNVSIHFSSLLHFSDLCDVTKGMIPR